MKGIITFLLLLTNFIVFAQKPNAKYETVEFSSIQIKNSQGKNYALGKPAQLQNAFGKAVIKKEIDEVLGGYRYVYYYNGLKVYFHSQQVQDATIENREYQLILNKQSYCVGDDIIKLKAKFPLAYKEGLSGTEKNKAFLIWITFDKKTTDAFVVVTYNAEGKIIEMSVREDNS